MIKIIDYDLSKIIVEDRARQDFGDLSELEASIKKRGLVNPICIHNDGRLIAGERRYRCCKKLGLKTIPVRIYENLTGVDRKCLEMEENYHKEFEWKEKAKLVNDIHLMMIAQYGEAKRHDPLSEGWSHKKTANLLGTSETSVSQYLKLFEGSKHFESVKKASGKTSAMKALNRELEIAALKEIAKRKAGKEKSLPYQLIKGKAEEEILNLPEKCVDLIIFDPPWGIEADKIASNRPGGNKINYDDSAKTAKSFAEKIMPEIYRVMKDGSHLLMFFGIEHYEFWIKLFEETGFDYIRKPPLVWQKEGGAFTDFEYYFMPSYELILHATKGVSRLQKPTSDVFVFNRPSNTKRIHANQKPVELLQKLIEVTTVEGQLILDPTCGSGATLMAATLSKRLSIGFEDNEENYVKALEWLGGKK